MCEPISLATLATIAAIGGGAASTAAAVKSFVDKPKMPGVPAQAQTPTTDAFRRKNAAAAAGALSGNSGTLAGGTGNVGTSTLLGQ